MSNVEIDLNTITSEELWKIYINWLDKKCSIDEHDWRSDKFSKILADEPQATYLENVNGFDVEVSDCFKYILARVPSISEKWVTISIINFHCDELTYRPEYVVLDDTHILTIDDYRVFSLVTKGGVENA
jgi:hypothetical protein